MNRTVLIVVAVLLLLFGIGRVGNGLMLAASMHYSGALVATFMAYRLGTGVAAIVAGVMILRAQLRGEGAGDAAQAAAAAHDTRRALKVVAIIIALLAGLAGLLLSLCGGILMQGNMGDGAGAILAIGLVLVVLAIAALAWAFRR